MHSDNNIIMARLAIINFIIEGYVLIPLVVVLGSLLNTATSYGQYQHEENDESKNNYHEGQY